jgi:group I intron endonuclease
MKPIGFIYLTTNCVNDKIYIGRREFLNDKKGNANYLGSGTVFKQAVKKYGKKNFKRKILRLCYSEHELRIWEHVYIKKYRSQVPSVGYNKADGDVNSSGYNPAKLPEIREKISKTLKMKYASGEIDKEKTTHRGINHPMYGKHHSEESKKRNSESKKRSIALYGHPMQGKHHSEETKKKISNSNREYAKTHFYELRERAKKRILLYGHPMQGKHHSEETKKKISEKAKAIDRGFWITDGVKNKICFSEIPDGWIKGRNVNWSTKKKVGLTTF